MLPSTALGAALCLIALTHAASAQPPAITFTAQEKSYIEHAGTITMCVDPDWVPFERIDERGQHEGIAADLIRLVAQRVGLSIEPYPVSNWEESLAASKSKRCQIMSFLNQTPERDTWLIFTQPLFFDPNVIITREEHPFIADPRGLRNASVALPRGTMVEERIRRDYPNLRVITTGSEQESVARVSERQADMTVRSLIVAAYAIKKEGLFNLKISGQLDDYTNQLRIGVQKDEKILRDILDKGVGTLTAQEREAISNKHVSINVLRETDYRLVWQILAAGALVLLGAFYWNRKLRVLNRELERLSVTDRLTGLYNRRKLDETLESELQRSLRFEQTFSIILLDIDHFKRINDAHGHLVGDQVLIEVSRLLQANTRETDIVGRWGGEEFMIICAQTDQDGALRLAENLRKALQDKRIAVVEQATASFGVCSYRSGELSAQLVERVDAALYTAKADGRNRVTAS